MAAPTFIASYSSDFSAVYSIAKSLYITTQPGDVVVIYAGIENGDGRTIDMPSGNGITFTAQQVIEVGFDIATAYVWTGTDTVGGTDWLLYTEINSPGTAYWGLTCLVFRGSSGIGTSGQAPGLTGAPALDLTTTADNSVIVLASFDWNAIDGASRTWRTVNGITPTSGNGLERDYAWVGVAYTAYGGYYSDTGIAGAKTVGLSGPGGQKYSLVAVEILGATTPPAASIAWLTA